MVPLVALHKKNRQTAINLRHEFSKNKLTSIKYLDLKKMLDTSALELESELYTYAEEENDAVHYLKIIISMLGMMYLIGLVAYIHSWVES